MVSICCRVAVEEFCTLCTAVCPGLTAALCVCVCVRETLAFTVRVCVVASFYIMHGSLEFPDLLASARESLRLFRQGPLGTIYKSHKQRHVNIVITPSYFQVLGGHVLFLTV